MPAPPEVWPGRPESSAVWPGVSSARQRAQWLAGVYTLVPCLSKPASQEGTYLGVALAWLLFNLQMTTQSA